MSTKELQELDQWIGVNVMKREPNLEYFASKDGGHSGALWDSDKRVIEEFIRDIRSPEGWECIRWEYWPHYTTNKMDAMEVLEKCCLEKSAMVMVQLPRFGNGKWLVRDWIQGESGEAQEIAAEADSLPLAICLFARKLFEQ